MKKKEYLVGYNDDTAGQSFKVLNLIDPTKREIFRIGFGDGLMNKLEEALTKLNKN